MIRLFPLLFLLAGAAWGEARFFAPVYFNPGALSELYAWDEAPVPSFSVQVRRKGAPGPLVVARGFSVNRPLSVLGGANRALKWSAALVGLDPFEAAGTIEVLFLNDEGRVLYRAESEIRSRTFPQESLVLDQTMSDLRSKPDKRKDKEAAEIWKVYLSFDGRFAWAGGRFRLPLVQPAPTSAHFGDVRNYLYSDGGTAKDYHRGTDFAVPSGTPVVAPAPGTVALVADRLLTGTTVVLEHAPGVYSVFFHLSQALVKKGQRLDAGSLLGLSGATGLVTGPHLHWEVRVDGHPVDALDLVTDGLLDTQAVSAVISSVERSIH